MGCDGGTIPTRDELVRVKKKPEQKDKNSELAFRWKHCAISQEKLTKPIVACELGRLYNKESVLTVLIDKTELSAMFRHLRGMRDIKELNLTENPAKSSRKAGTGDGYVDSGISDYICPVVGLEMSGRYKFCFLWNCGCVLSERALKEVKSKVCHKCGKAYDENDIIPLNGTAEEETALEHRMDARRALAKAAKKLKKGDKTKEPQTNGTEMPSTSSSGAGCSKDAPSKASTSLSGASCSKDAPSKASTSLSGASCSKDGHSKAKTTSNGAHSKTEPQSKLLSTTSKDTKSVSEKAGTKRKLGIQEDPKSSKTFKSLFTSCEKAKKQGQAHWVTYNPMYY